MFLGILNSDSNEKGFTVLELVVAVGVLMVLIVASLTALPNLEEWRDESQVKIATSTAFKTGVNALTNPWGDLTVEEVSDYIEEEYKNVNSMDEMFTGEVWQTNKFSQNISNWNVDKVTSRVDFNRSSQLTAAQLPNWKV